MAKVCQVTGKRPKTGNNVSHANNRTRRRFLPNLQKKRFWDPEANRWITLKLSASAIRTIYKVGISKILKKLRASGQKV